MDLIINSRCFMRPRFTKTADKYNPPANARNRTTRSIGIVSGSICSKCISWQIESCRLIMSHVNDESIIRINLDSEVSRRAMIDSSGELQHVCGYSSAIDVDEYLSWFGSTAVHCLKSLNHTIFTGMIPAGRDEELLSATDVAIALDCPHSLIRSYMGRPVALKKLGMLTKTTNTRMVYAWRKSVSSKKCQFIYEDSIPSLMSRLMC